MRHRRLRRKLGVKSQHRRALLRNLVRNLVIYKKIRTTFAKAKEASSFADQMVTIAKRGDLHSRRLLISNVGCADTADSLIKKIAPVFKERQGGYTRVLRMENRPGDQAEMALLEFTAVIEMPKKERKPKKAKKESPAKEVELEKPKKEKKDRLLKAEDEKPETKKASGVKEDAASKEEKKESEKKGGFLGALRKFLKGE